MKLWQCAELEHSFDVHGRAAPTHMLFLDGVYTGGAKGHPLRFSNVKPPKKGGLTRLAHTIAQRVGRYQDCQGLLERDTGNIFLTQEAVATKANECAKLERFCRMAREAEILKALKATLSS